MDAQTLCAQVRAELADVEERILGNSWLAELEAGRLPPAALRAFAGEQLQVIPSDLRSFQMLADRFAGDPAGGYLEGMVAGERAALQALETFAAAVGLDEPARVTSPLPAARRTRPSWPAWPGTARRPRSRGHSW
jgi:hypothetical protein